MADAELPDFIPPMLAKLGSIFDSEEHIFEVKWDGIRSQALVERGSVRMYTRSQRAMRERYPEFEFLDQLPPGVALDGEVVVLAPNGQPSFNLALKREQTKNPTRIATLSKTLPALFVAFDLLYQDFESIMPRPLVERRERLQELIENTDHSRLVLSEAVESDGPTFFEEICRREMEGVVAKRRTSRYSSGKRGDAWIKCKRNQIVQCVVIGYQMTGPNLKSLIIATNDDEDQLRCVGKVGSGISDELRDQLLGQLKSSPRSAPIVATNLKGHWVEPELFCQVAFLEKSPGGELRAPTFKGFVE